MVTDGGSRFREGLPAANICNLVHKAPAFVVVSLDRERSGPAPGLCQRHWLPHYFPAGRSPRHPGRGAGHFPRPCIKCTLGSVQKAYTQIFCSSCDHKMGTILSADQAGWYFSFAAPEDDLHMEHRPVFILSRSRCRPPLSRHLACGILRPALRPGSGLVFLSRSHSKGRYSRCRPAWPAPTASVHR